MGALGSKAYIRGKFIAQAARKKKKGSNCLRNWKQVLLNGEGAG